jgi:hypothetical protein
MGNFSHMAACKSSLENTRKNELNTYFQQNTCSYGVGIGHAWCSQKACEICSLLIRKKKLKKYFFFFIHAAQAAIDQFLVSRNFRD